MNLPGFEITQHIQSLALEIVDLLDKLPALDTDAKFLQLRKDNRIKTIQSSLAIEANSLSLQQVADIINGKKVTGDIREIQEVKNAWAAYEKIGQYDPFSLDSLLHAHSLISNRLVKHSGTFRTMQVNVYKGYELLHTGARPKEIPTLMARLFDWARNSNVNAIIKSCILHFAIEYVHPFEDGNGRMGRLWQTVVLHHWNKNFQWIPVETMVYQNQQGYYAALDIAGKKNSANVFIEFMLGILKFTLGAIIESRKAKANAHAVASDGRLGEKLGEKLGETQKKILRLMTENPFVTINALAKRLGISTTAVENNIAKLKVLGFVARVGADRGGHWEVMQP